MHFPILTLLLTLSAPAGQPAKDTAHHQLFTAGVASGLMGGLYDGFYPIDSLVTKGDFGLGAPDKIDGELLFLDGKAYQTQYTGKTTEVSHRQQLTPFSMVNFFHTDLTFVVHQSMDKAALYHYLDSLLPNMNGLYAIHIKGKFSHLKTRAFPPVHEAPYPPLAGMLGLQHFFQFDACTGDLVGYRLPAYMDNTNIAGYHFHYLSDARDAGGHIVDVATADVVITVSILNSYTLQIPSSPAFDHFDFKQNRQEDIKSVEKGSK